MATFVFANFFQTTLASPASSSATSITVASGTGAPTISAGQQWALVLQSAATPSVREVVYVTAVSGAAFTVVRAQEGTTALSWSAADNVFGSNTAGQMASFFETVTPLGGVLGGTLPNPSIVTNINLPGAPTTTTAASTTNSTQIATTAFVMGTSSLAEISGWKKSPDPSSPTGYIIEQWGQVPAITGGSGVAITFPLTFPNGLLSVVAVAGATAPSAGATLAGVQASTSGFNAYNASASAGTQPGLYIAKGW